MADRLTEVLEDLGLQFARAVNPVPGPAAGLTMPETQPSYAGQPRLRDQPGGMQAFAPEPVGVTPMPDVGAAPVQGWQPQGVQFPNTQGGSPTLAAPQPAPSVAAPPMYGPPASAGPGAAPPPQPASDLAGGVSTLVQQLLGNGPPDIAREGSVNPMQPPSGEVPPLPVGQPDAELARLLGIEPRPQAPSISTAQMSGYEPRAGGGNGSTAATAEASRQGGYGPSWQRSPPASPGPGRGGGSGAGATPPSTAPAAAGGSPPPSAASTPPAAPPTSQSRSSGVFGSISPRTFQILGVIGATLAMGQRPGESQAAAFGRAIGAGMMYDNFARLSDVEREQSERALAIKEKQLGIQSRRTDIDEAQARSQIEVAKRRLALAEREDERAAAADELTRLQKRYQLLYTPAMLEADLAAKRATAGKAGQAEQAQLVELVKSMRLTDGTPDWAGIGQAARISKLGTSAPDNVRKAFRETLARIKDPKAQAAERTRMNEALMQKGWLPE